MKNTQIDIKLIIVTILLFISGVIAHADNKSLFKALCVVESNNNRLAINRKELARGIIQIRPVYVDDVNRILGTKKYKYIDCYNVVKSYEMFVVYTNHYGKRYTRLTGKPCTSEIKARLHNGGPNGYKKSATDKYWKKVKSQMK